MENQPDATPFATENHGHSGSDPETGFSPTLLTHCLH